MFEEKLDSSGGVQDWADGIANATSVISSLGATISSVQGLIDTFNNPDASAWDRLGAVFGVLMTILPALPPLFSLVGSTGAAAGTGITAAMGPVGWVILGITAAIAGLTLGLSAIADAYNADAIAASRA
jgi:hypothetical protein